MFLIVMDLGSRRIITLVMDSSLVKPFCVNLFLSSMDHDNSRSIALTVGPQYVSNLAVYGVYSSPFILKKGEVVKIVLNNNHANLHPQYLHGHLFQVIQRSDLETGPFTAKSSSPFRCAGKKSWPTSTCISCCALVLRFIANKPSVWVFYCHVEWHVEAGLTVTMFEAPEEMRTCRFLMIISSRSTTMA